MGIEKVIFLKQLIMRFGQTNDERKRNQHTCCPIRPNGDKLIHLETKVPAFIVSPVLSVSLSKLQAFARQTETLHRKNNHTFILQEDPSSEKTCYTLITLERRLLS